MPNFKFIIEYDGRNFSGWQIQKKGERTIQGEIKKALERITKTSVTVVGAGRTDSGVHALGQTAHARLKTALDAATLLKALNANLPDDIAITKIQKVRNDFHAQYHAKTKIYRYTILHRTSRATKERGFYWHIPRKLNVRLMRSESKSLIGRHDFSSFTATDTWSKKHHLKKNTVRSLKRIAITSAKGFLYIDIEADGFLYKMVRNIVGTLIETGTGKLHKGDIKRILLSKLRRNAGPTAPAQGLCLLKVKY